MLREISGPAGVLEVVIDQPSGERGVTADGLIDAGGANAPRAAVVLAHPHPQMGGSMHTKALFHAAKALARTGCVVLRFNFRGVGRSAGAWDEGNGEQADAAAALAFMHERYPELPVWAGGMSFGSWIGMTVGARDPNVSALIGISVPIGRYDFSSVRDSQKAKFFVHGERDEITAVKEIRQFYAGAAEPKELVIIDAADHLFDGKTSEVADAIEDLLADWTDRRET
jgi:alpha/beta superfamily hydrolase